MSKDEAALDKKDILRLVQHLGLSAGHYAVCGSAVMAMHGLRPAGDIDFIVTAELYHKLQSEGWREEFFPDTGRPRALFSGPFDAGEEWSVGDYRPDPLTLIAAAEIISG